MNDVFGLFGFYIYNNKVYLSSKIKFFIWCFIVFPITFFIMIPLGIVLFFTCTIFGVMKDLLSSIKERAKENLDYIPNSRRWIAPWSLAKIYINYKKVIVPKDEFKEGKNNRYTHYKISTIEKWDKEFDKSENGDKIESEIN